MLGTRYSDRELYEAWQMATAYIWTFGHCCLSVWIGIVFLLVTLCPPRWSEKKINSGESTHHLFQFAARVCRPPLPPLIYKREANVNPYLTAAKSVPIFSTPPNACIIVKLISLSSASSLVISSLSLLARAFRSASANTS